MTGIASSCDSLTHLGLAYMMKHAIRKSHSPHPHRSHLTCSLLEEEPLLNASFGHAQELNIKQSVCFTFARSLTNQLGNHCWFSITQDRQQRSRSFPHTAATPSSSPTAAVCCGGRSSSWAWKRRRHGTMVWMVRGFEVKPPPTKKSSNNWWWTLFDPPSSPAFTFGVQ